MSPELQPVSWSWIKAVLVSSVFVLAVSGGILVPISRLLDEDKLGRLSKWIRWLLVLPTAMILGYVAEIVPRLAFSIIEVVVNHHLLFRPGVDSVVWQLWAPLFFVAGGVQMAPNYKLGAFLVVGGLKIGVAVMNLATVLRFVGGGGTWSAVDPIASSPLWWNSVIYSLCILLLCAFGILLGVRAYGARTRHQV